METIFALATPYAKSALAIIRISGSDVTRLIKDIGRKNAVEPRKIYRHKVEHPDTGEVLDDCVIIYFKAPSSATGEDILEIQCHGGIAVIDDILSMLSNLNYLRLAEPGEFTRRALFNEQISLAEAEAIVAIIDAETSLQREVAIKQISGQLQSICLSWRKKLITLLSQFEAFIDFPEDDIPANVIAYAYEEIEELIGEMESVMINEAAYIECGLSAVIHGAPNVGKSTIFNKLANADLAIVSNIPGTTRDVLSVKVEIAGLLVTISDTAGIRSTENIIEKIGIERAIKAHREADISIRIINIDDSGVYSDDIVICNKVDLLDHRYNGDYIGLSAKQDITPLITALANLVQEKYNISNTALITKMRHKLAISNAINYLKAMNSNLLFEIATENLRLATEEIGVLIGAVNLDEILDELFSSFCIGK